jgi:hypothetical protein
MLQVYISNVSEVFRGMFQVFHTDIAKVGRDVAYICCKRLSPMFHLFFRHMLQVCFIRMLHMFHIFVASVYLDVAFVL